MAELLRDHGHHVVEWVIPAVDETSLIDLVVAGHDERLAIDTIASAMLPSECPVLLTCGYVNSNLVRAALVVGFAGVVSRHTPSEFLVGLTVAASSGHLVIPSELRAVFENPATPPRDLTPTEQLLLRAVARNTLDEAAAELGYSRRHTQRLLSKLLRSLGLPDSRSTVLAAGAWGIAAVPPALGPHS